MCLLYGISEIYLSSSGTIFATKVLTIYYKNMTDTPLGPEAIIETYGLDATVVVGGGKVMKLGQALQFEAMFCPAEDIRRQDPTKRSIYLAGMLAAGGTILHPDHQALLPAEMPE